VFIWFGFSCFNSTLTFLLAVCDMIWN